MQSYDVQSIIDKYSNNQPLNIYIGSQQNTNYINKYQWMKDNEYNKINESYLNKNPQVKHSYIPNYIGSSYDHSYHNKDNLNGNFSYQSNLTLEKSKSQYSQKPAYQSKHYNLSNNQVKNNVKNSSVDKNQIYGQRQNNNKDLSNSNQVNINKYLWENSNAYNQNNSKTYKYQDIANTTQFNINQDSKPSYSNYWENKISSSSVGKPSTIQAFKQQNSLKFDTTKTSQSQVFRVNPSNFYGNPSNKVYNYNSSIYPVSNNINQLNYQNKNNRINQSNQKYQVNPEIYSLPKSSNVTQTPKFNMPQIRLNQETTYNKLNQAKTYNGHNQGTTFNRFDQRTISNGFNSTKSINSDQYINKFINGAAQTMNPNFQGVAFNQPSSIISLKKSTITYPSGLTSNPTNPNNQLYKKVSGAGLGANKQGFIPLHKTEQQSNDDEIDKFQEPERKVYNTFQLKDNITYTKQEEFHKNNKCMLGSNRVTYDLKTHDDHENNKILGNWC